MATKSEINVTRIQDILDDIKNLHKLLQKDPKSALKQCSAFDGIPHPSGTGDLISSAITSERLQELSDYALTSRGLKRVVSIANVKKALKREISTRFFLEGRDVSVREVQKMLTAAAKKAEKSRADKTFFFPIRFLHIEEPDELHLGPVKILTRKALGTKLVPAMKEFLRYSKEPDDSEWGRKHLREALENYRSFKWFVEVPILSCDSETSNEAAEKAVHSTLDWLHLLLGRKQSYRLTVGGAGIEHDKRSTLGLDAENTLLLSTSYGGLDHVGYSEGWSKDLERDDVKYMTKLIGIVLQVRSDPSLSRPVCERLLDGAKWFGEGVRDKSMSAKVVKFMTAIERVVMTGHSNNIVHTVSERVADVMFDPENLSGWENTYNDVKTAYDLRSDLVHGNISPDSEVVSQGVSKCGDLAEELLVAALHRVGEPALHFEKLTDKQYAQWFADAREHISKLR